MPDAPPSAFDAVIVVAPDAHTVLAGTTCLTRATFTAARAGARRILAVGAPQRPTPRLPEVPLEWSAPHDATAIASWAARGRPPVVVLAATTVIDPATLAAFAAAPGAGRLSASAGFLRRCAAASLAHELDDILRGTGPSGARRSRDAAAIWTPPADALLIDASTQSGRDQATRALFRRLGRAGDSWFTRHVDRRLSTAITRRLLPTGIAPNTITIVSVMIGLSGAALFATGTHGGAIAGALLFLASTIIDGCDGEVARLTFRESRFGARLDLVGDNVVHLGLFAGIAVGLYRQSQVPRIAVLGVLLVVGVLVSMATVWWSLVARRPTRAQRRLFEAFASREFAYGLVVLTAAGLLEWFLWAAAIGNYVFSAALLALGRVRPS